MRRSLREDLLKGGYQVDVGHHSAEHDARDKSSDITANLSHSQECHSERARIGDEMAKAYPDERDFEIACRFNQAEQNERTRIG
jgi:hypothetical protein